MKTVGNILLACLLLSGLIISCKEDEQTDQLIGTWTLLSETKINCTNEAENHYNAVECTNQFCRKITFKNDDTFKVEETDEGVKQTIPGTYQKDGDQITLCFDGNCDEPVTYTINNGSLTISGQEVDTGCIKTVVFTK